jgi:methylmalonyl-CoA/ethylmalonyl-CoA epimerase
VNELVFHHIGVACRDIGPELRQFALLGYEPEGDTFEDPIQRITGLFIGGPGPRLELLAPLGESDMLTPWLSQGVKYYHQAYLTPDIISGIERFRLEGARVTVDPVPATAFGGRRIAFMLLRNMALIELVESPDAG